MSNANRPLSPHLQVYRWGAHMLVSILHRATGFVLSIGALALVWWLVVLAQNDLGYFEAVADLFGSVIGRLALFGFTFALMQHLASGIRHLLMDTGALYILKDNRLSARLTLVFSLLATIAIWVLAYCSMGRL